MFICDFFFFIICVFKSVKGGIQELLCLMYSRSAGPPPRIERRKQREGKERNWN